MRLSVIYNKNEDDEYLLEQCKAKNPKAQKILYEKYYNQMYTLCLRYVNDEEDAVDVVHEGFVKVFERLKSFKNESKFTTWMRAIFMHTAIDYFRSNKEYKKRFITTKDLEYFQTQVDLDIDSNAEQFSQEFLFELVKNLPPATRMVFNLYVIEELAHKEISKQLKISIGTSKWHLANARKILAIEVKKELYKKQKENGIR